MREEKPYFGERGSCLGVLEEGLDGVSEKDGLLMASLLCRAIPFLYIPGSFIFLTPRTGSQSVAVCTQRRSSGRAEVPSWSLGPLP